jgi:metallo-beta-lactamase family protein
MKISFHGAARTVTGSKHVLTLNNGDAYLLDCGMFQGMGPNTAEMNREWGFDPARINALFLSHAHIDHSGLIPKLVRDGFRGKIYCTPATADLSRILLLDSAEIQEDDAKYANKRNAAEGRPYVQPLYTLPDVELALPLFVSVEYGSWHRVNDDVEILFTDAGHIIGSAAVHVRAKEQGKTIQLSFSGDVGRYRDIILKSPDNFPQADYILLESTYGNSLHDVQHTTPEILLGYIQKTCIEKKGKLILPAFSVGRTQELLYTMNQLEVEGRLPAVDYFVDSPLSVEATEVIKSYPQYFNRTLQKVLQSDQDPFSFKGLSYIRSVEESKRLNYRNEPCVIISASGMADAGRVKHHISNNIENSRNTILMTGYCEPSSLGGRLLAGAKEVRIFGVVHEVHADIAGIRSMSAHGDYEDLSQFLAYQDPRAVKKLFLVHGEYDVQTQFRERLMRKGFQDVEIPSRHYQIGLT